MDNYKYMYTRLKKFLLNDMHTMLVAVIMLKFYFQFGLKTLVNNVFT